MHISIKRLSLVGFVVGLSTAAQAADLPEPIIEHIPSVPVAAGGGGLYLRGDIGYKFYNAPQGSFNDSVIGDLRFERETMDDAWMIGVGVGYQFNDYFRSDITIDYETAAEVKGYAFCGLCTGGYSTEATDVDVWTVMLNGYVDLGTWNKITPYVGAGIGASYVTTNNTYSINPGSTGKATYDGKHSEWNFAWALMAGAEYAVTENWSIDAGYQYRDLGDAATVQLHDAGSGQTRVEWEDLTAHEVRLGVRYNFGGGGGKSEPAYYQPQGPISSNF